MKTVARLAMFALPLVVRGKYRWLALALAQAAQKSPWLR